MTDFETLRYDSDGAVATIAFDHGKVNAMTPLMHKELYHALKQFLNDDGIKVGILTSVEGKPFSVGEDIKTPRPKENPGDYVWRHLNPHAAEAQGADPGRPGWDWDIMQLERYKPLIGAVRGWCLGQGILYLLHHTDIRIASEDAKFGFPEIGYSMGGVAGWIRLGRQIPHVHAMELALTGDLIDAQRAAELNMINRVVPEIDLLPEARRIAERIARHPTLGIRTEMESYYRSHDMTREQAVAFSGHLYRLQRVAAGEDDLGEMLRK